MTEPSGNEIAIVGMAGAFPGAPDVATFWRNLRAGVESISFHDDTQLEVSPLVPEQLRTHPAFVPAGGVLDGVDLFDHDLFGIPRREARWMDPQQRIFLQLAWTALEDAGYDPARFAGRISVYAGAGSSGHLLSLLAHVGTDPASLYEAVGGASADNLATRVSFLLRLRGESMNVHTACSTGLATVHLACQSLLLGQSNLALAGAAAISVPQRTGYVSQEGMILSADGHCRAFDHRASGTVPGNGAAVVVLKPLADALADRDQIHAVVRGSAVNNEGHRSVGYTAPSVAAQAEVIAEALAFAGVTADDIGYVEAHGTGTPLGDPIEITALTRAFRRTSDRVGDCPIGSVKTNIGHLDTAAGIAGLIKTALVLRHGEIPPSLHLERPNPAIDFAASPFTVNTRLRPMSRPRLAGVSSFGIGGTNVHAVLAEPPMPPMPPMPPSPSADARPSHRPNQLVTLAAHTPSALSTMAGELADVLSVSPAPPLADVAYTRAVGRAQLRHRRSHVAADAAELVDALRATADGEPPVAGQPRIGFLFPGNGAAEHGMAADLYRAEPVFRDGLDRCVAELEPRLGRPLLPVLLAGEGPIEDAELAHAGLFAVEHALASTWLHWGVRPDALLGHSFGEYAAACVAGVFSIADAAELAVVRGRLVGTLPPGAMVSVGLDEDELARYLSPPLSLAAVNGEARCVVSGPLDAIDELRSRLAAAGHATVDLPVRQAFHSPAVDPIVGDLEATVAGCRQSAPELPLVSARTGTWWADGDATARHWGRQMRDPVRFAAALSTVAGSDGQPLVLVEAGPGQVLTALARSELRKRASVVPSMRRRRDSGSDHRTLMEAVGALWRRGAAVDWDAFYGAEQRRRVALPTYPFEGQDCSLDPGAGVPVVRPAPAAQATGPAPEPQSEPAPAEPAQAADTAADAATDTAAGSPGGPRDDVERQVFAIWAERLGTDDFGVDDDFLELGGNSLMAAQMITRLRAAFSVPIPLSALFEAPTVAGIADRVRAALGQHGQGHGATTPDPATPAQATAPPALPPPRPVPRDGRPLPLSVVQARTLALEAADPGNPGLVMPFAIELDGRLDVDALREAITAVIDRHEALRTTFHRSGDGWTQRIEQEPRVRLPVVQLTGTVAERVAAAERRAREQAHEPFDLSRSPLGLELLRLGDRRHVLLVTLHHVVSDTLSVVNFVQEVAAGYAASVTGRPSPLRALPLQYADFAAWQRKLLESGALERQRAYWRERMRDLPPPLPLPSDRPRLSERGIRSSQLATRLPAGVSQRVAELGRRLGTTQFVTLLAAYAAWLGRISGADDIVIGTPIGNRDRAELEPLIGYVAHALPLRVDLGGDPGFAELVSRTQQTLLSAYANPDLPYEELVAQTQPGRDTGRSRIFDAMFVLHSGIPNEQELPGMTWRVWEMPDMPAMFGATLATLSLMLAESPDGLAGTLEYADELFDAATAARLVDQFATLVDDGTRRPEARLSELVLDRSPAPPTRIGIDTGAGTGTGTGTGEAAGWLARWLATVDAMPDAVALTGPDATVSRSELAAYSTQVAWWLGRHGDGRTVRLDLPPSARRLAALLGALRAGRPVALPAGAAPDTAVTVDARSLPAFAAGNGAGPDVAAGHAVAGTGRPWTGAPPDGDAPALLEPAGDGWRTWSHLDVSRYLVSMDDAVAAGDDGGSNGRPNGRRRAVLAAEEPFTVPAALDLLWALATGRAVHVAPDTTALAGLRWLPPAARDPRTLQFSLSYFANDEDSLDGPKYGLLLDGVRLADELGLAAVWTPERHFHSFGGLYPSPTATSAALATASRRIGIRAGSVVLPLHEPVRVAEDWAVIDNLSGGRVGVSFASGWHPDDFVLAPDRYTDRREVMRDGIEVVRRLWRGEKVRRRNGVDEHVDVSIRPRPVQPELPFWLTAAGSPDTFRLAGELGGFVLTNLMAQSVDDLAAKIELYRQAWRAAGHAGSGHVTLMLHTFLADDAALAHAQARQPLLRYFRSSVGIARGFAVSQGLTVRPEDLSEDDLQSLLEHGLDRYLHDGGLFGTPDSCAELVERVRAIGVDEVAALIDFGVPDEDTLRGIELLAELAEREAARARAAAAAATRQTTAAVAALGRLIADRHIGIVQAPPDLLAWLADVAGEAVTGRILLAGDPGRAGNSEPTEATDPTGEAVARLLASTGATVSLRHRLPGGDWIAARTPRANPGAELTVRPAPGAGARVVDVVGRELGAGVVGQLVLAGAATGQRARWRPDGRLDLLPPPRRRQHRDLPAAGAQGSIRPVDRNRPLPLSFAQQRLWYLDQLVPGNVAYNNTVALRMRGTLDIPALHRALQEVVRRHEVLRTTVCATGDGAVQLIHPAVDIELPTADVTGGSPDQVGRLAREFARTPFDLGEGPLLRASVLRLAPSEHVLLIGMHHIVSDGWSAGVLFGELAALYAAFSAGEPSPLPPLAVQYADYAGWQRKQLTGDAIAGELAYWTETLAGVPMLELPLDRPRGPVQSQHGARSPVHLDGELTAALGRLCRNTGTTPYMALHAALATLLHRYSGQTDLAIGTAVAGRTLPETEQLVGCFINTVAVRTDLAGDPTFRELLGRVKDATLGALAHQDVPFERLVDELRLPRTLSNAPLVQAMFVLHNTPSPRVQLGELTLEALEVDSGTAKLDLVLELREGTDPADGIAGSWEYNTDLFDAATIEQLTRHLAALLAAAVAAPDRRLSRLDLVAGDERRRLLALSAGPPLPDGAEPAAATVPAAFEAQVARTPHAVAVAGDRPDQRPLTYRELDARANAIAHGLRRAGVGRADLVALLVRQPTDAIAAMLGVLKAGAAYVPIDPLAPRGRQELLVEQCEPAAILSDVLGLSELAGRPVIASADLASVDLASADLAGADPASADPAGATDPAYVIFTSGSTGQPKGVLVEHGQLLASTRARRAHYGPPGRCLNLYALTFDGSVAWIYFALLTGGAVCCPPADTMADPHELAELVARWRPQRLATVPALYGQLLAAASPERLSSLRSVTVGGEACLPELVRAHADALPETELHNEYGPTEATVWSTVHRVPPGTAGRVPIGRPIPGARSYVLDPHRGLLPAGAAGELYVGGPALARGYLGEADLTRQRFVPDPFDAAGGRLYRTGDRARWNRHGQLEYLGRMDRQVKVRGFRVEPAEVEAVLAAHPAVAEAAVVAARSGASNRLVGYAAVAPSAAVDPEELRAYARGRLPEYLVPARIVVLASLPRGRHGKLDLAALPDPDLPADPAPAAPRTDVERTIAAVVAEVLDRPDVGIHDNFFDLGGDSILAMSVVSTARQRSVELTVRQLFHNPTVARLAAVAGTRLAVQADQGTVAGPVPLTPIQRWFFGLELPNPAQFNMSVQLELAERPRADLLQQAMRAVLHHHDALRLRFVRDGGRWRQRNAPSEPGWRLDTVDLSAVAPRHQHAELVAHDQRLQESLDLANGPLLRAALVRRGPQPDRLLLVAHHLVTDAVSWRVIIADLLTAYRQLDAGRQVELPPKATSYAEWARRLPEFTTGAAGLADLDYWSGLPYHLAPRLPRDGDGPNVHSAARTVRAELDEPATTALLRAGDPQDALIAAVAIAVAGWTGADHVQLDLERHGREDLVPEVDLTRTVGWFSDFHPLVVPVRGGASPADVLAGVAEHVRAVPHHGAGYVPLRYGTRHDGTGHPPLLAVPESEITINYLGRLDLALPPGSGATVLGEALGSLRAADTPRPYLVEITAGVLDGRLWTVWTFTEGVHRAQTIARLAGDVMATLRALAAASAPVGA